MAGEIKASPQNYLLGLLAQGFGAAKSGLNQVQLPVVGGFGDLMLGQAPELLNNISYQGLSAIAPGLHKANVPIAAPGVVDLAGALTGISGFAKPVLQASGKAVLPIARRAAESIGENSLTHFPQAYKQIGSIGNSIGESKYAWQVLDESGNILKEYPKSYPKKSIIDRYEQDIAKENQAKIENKIRAAENRKISKERKESSARLTSSFSENFDTINNAHKNQTLDFIPLKEEDFLQKQGILLHSSPNYGKKSGSQYRLIEVNGEPAYARSADHWGEFSTNDWVDGEQVSRSHLWNHPEAGQTNWGNKQRFYGYIPVKDLKND